MSETYDSTQDTQAHISLVRSFLWQVFDDLHTRGRVHDASKFEEPEKSAFDIIRPRLDTADHLSPEYMATLEEFEAALDHHYAHNRHHPQHFPEGVAGMTLSDVYEMLCDWAAASQRKPGGKLELDGNFERFGIDGQLASILRNTAKEMGW